MERQHNLCLSEFAIAAGECGYMWGEIGRDIVQTQFFSGCHETLIVARCDGAEGLPARSLVRIYEWLFNKHPEADSMMLDLTWRARP